MNCDISAAGLGRVFKRLKKYKPIDAVDINKRTDLDIQSSPVMLYLGGGEVNSYLKNSN